MKPEKDETGERWNWRNMKPEKYRTGER